jgi:hypothetical protein
VTDERANSEPEAIEQTVNEIRGDIDEIRGEMGGTLQELGDRLDPGHLVQQAKENVREATIGRVEEKAKGVSDMVMETIRRNPIPAAMAGIGLGVLWMNRSPEDGRTIDRYGRRIQSRAGDIGLQAREKAAGVAAGMSETAAHVGENITQSASQVGENIGAATSQVAETISEGVDDVRWNFERIMEANPLAVGLVALGAGAVVGALVPTTEQERHTMGEASRQIGTAVRDTVDEVTSKAQEQLDRAEESMVGSETT